MNHPVTIVPAEPRDNAQVWFEDGRIFTGPIGAPLEDYVRAAGSNPEAPTVAALIDLELRELGYRVEGDVEVTPITMADSDGLRIYCRSLVFLLVVAARELYPEATVYVDHSLTFGGYFCQVYGRPAFSADELARIEARMRDIGAPSSPPMSRSARSGCHWPRPSLCSRHAATTTRCAS
jgi:uridine kinase